MKERQIMTNSAEQDSVVLEVMKDKIVRFELVLVAVGLIALTFFSSASPTPGARPEGKGNTELQERVRMLTTR